MTTVLQVLGIDMASRSWEDNGSAIVRFTTGADAQWNDVDYRCVKWPTSNRLSPESMAEVIQRTIEERQITAVSLDGPQGWREPNAPPRLGVGRDCEYHARCQGKTGEKGRSYPQTQHGWISFCIDLFAELMKRGRARIVNSVEGIDADQLEAGEYFLLECFPTSTWRESGLTPLPGKRRVGNNSALVEQYLKSLQRRFGLPVFSHWSGSHDDLQAIVAALPAVGLLKGPCVASSKGSPGKWYPNADTQDRWWVEGLIWDAKPLQPQLGIVPENIQFPIPSTPKYDGKNPLLLDDRDDEGELLLERGINLFQYLAQSANDGNAIGIGYAQLICCVHGVQSFEQVANRRYSQSDTRYVLEFAYEITSAAGGPIRISRNGVAINVGMDAFIWKRRRPHSRPTEAFTNAAYSYLDWLAIFPDGKRQLISTEQCAAMPQV